MLFTEAKEHAPGRLHEIFADPYTAFDNMTIERLPHLRVAVAELMKRPLHQGRLVLRIIHGWENGGCTPEALSHHDYRLTSLDCLRTLQADLHEILEGNAKNSGELLARPLSDAIGRTEKSGNDVDEETRRTPSRWPSFKDGLWLYTLFKVYHRLIYGEDDPYRSIHLRLPEGEREVHEFHLEEGEFAIIAPIGNRDEDSLLLLHPSQLPPVLMLLENSQLAEGALC